MGQPDPIVETPTLRRLAAVFGIVMGLLFCLPVLILFKVGTFSPVLTPLGPATIALSIWGLRRIPDERARITFRDGEMDVLPDAKAAVPQVLRWDALATVTVRRVGNSYSVAFDGDGGQARVAGANLSVSQDEVLRRLTLHAEAVGFSLTLEKSSLSEQIYRVTQGLPYV